MPMHQIPASVTSGTIEAMCCVRAGIGAPLMLPDRLDDRPAMSGTWRQQTPLNIAELSANASDIMARNLER
jgi:hypothetical protein